MKVKLESQEAELAKYRRRFRYDPDGTRSSINPPPERLITEVENQEIEEVAGNQFPI